MRKRARHDQIATLIMQVEVSHFKLTLRDIIECAHIINKTYISTSVIDVKLRYSVILKNIINGRFQISNRYGKLQ